jgi:DNA-binding transcriptional MerR regulator
VKAAEGSKVMSADDRKRDPQTKTTISELAGEFGVTPRAIRYYEEVGLLSPHRNTPTSQRLYDDRDRARLKLILRGKRFGYTLAELVDILELYEADPTQKKQIIRTLEYGFQHIRDIDERIDELLEIRGEMLEFATSFLEILELESGDGEDVEGFIALAKKAIEAFEGKGSPAGYRAAIAHTGNGRQEGRAVKPAREKPHTHATSHGAEEG